MFYFFYLFRQIILMVLLLKYGVNIMETPKSKSYTVYTYQVLLKPLGIFTIVHLNFPHGD